MTTGELNRGDISLYTRRLTLCSDVILDQTVGLNFEWDGVAWKTN